MSLSLLNSIVGPVMRGPSSSHAAAPFFIGSCCRQLSCGFGEKLLRAKILFDPTGTFAPVYKNQGSDQGFAAGLSGIAMRDENYTDILPARLKGDEFKIEFLITPLQKMTHPNRVDVILTVTDPSGTTRDDHYQAISSGGGMFEIFSCNGASLNITGATPAVVIKGTIEAMPLPFASLVIDREIHDYSQFNCRVLPDLQELLAWQEKHNITELRLCDATQYPADQTVKPLSSALQVLSLCRDAGDLATVAKTYEAQLLNVSEQKIEQLFLDRVTLMLGSVEEGFSQKNDNQRMKYMPSTASGVWGAKLAPSLGGDLLQTAIAGALAVMEQNAMRGIVTAAPTAGSAGVIPGCLYGLKASGFSDRHLADALAVMALIGTVYGERATFAAEVGGCQVETGAAAAMAAGGLVFLHGGSPEQSFDAATMVMMNTLGLICDPVGGEVEIPCLARNVAGVSHAYSSALSIMAGFQAVLSFDDLVDTTLEVGKKMHLDFRCTARGGCAATKSAHALVAAFSSSS